METMEKKHPVIVSARMKDSALLRELSKVFNVKVASQVDSDVIFPTFSSVSFVVLGLSRAPPAMREKEKERVAQASSKMKYCFVLLLFTEEHSEFLLDLQQSLPPKTQLVLCRSEGELFSLIFNIAGLFSKEQLTRIEKEAEQKEAELLHHATSCAVAIEILTKIPNITRKDAEFLQDGLGNLQHIAQASAEGILRATPLSREQANIIHEYFRVDRVEE